MNEKYRQRFLRSLGILTEADLERFQKMTIAIGGLGLGGSIFMNLVRMGFQNFRIADPDVYERTNIGRQREAKEPTVGRRKDVSLAEEAEAINPEVQIYSFEEGIQLDNVDEFLLGVDWVIDTVDVFAMESKLALNDVANRHGIPVASCGSLGFSGAMIVFEKGGPSFAELSGISMKNPDDVNLAHFLQFLSPEIPEYMKEQLFKAVARTTHIPFMVAGVEIAAAMAATAVAKQILGLGEKIVAPYGQYFDPLNLRAIKFEADYRKRDFGIAEFLASLQAPLKKAA